MARNDILTRLSSINKTPLEFNYDSLICRYNIYNLLSQTDIGDIGYIATSVKYMGNAEKRISYIDNIMRNRSFKKYHAGTNRTVYLFLDDRSFVIKVPIDKNGMEDNVSEFSNQEMIRPFCTKQYQTTERGEVAFSEKVIPIQTKEEFISVAGDYYNLMTTKIIGRYIFDDIGSSKFMNLGIRPGFGLVILDYPKVFELDGGKLRCTHNPFTGIICNGEIDFDIGFDNLICTICGRKYDAKDMAKQIKYNKIILDKGEISMRVIVSRGNEILIDSSRNEKEAEVMRKTNLTVSITKDGQPLFEKDEEEDNTKEIIVRAAHSNRSIPVSHPPIKETVEKESISEEIIKEVLDYVTEEQHVKYPNESIIKLDKQDEDETLYKTIEISDHITPIDKISVQKTNDIKISVKAPETVTVYSDSDSSDYNTIAPSLRNLANKKEGDEKHSSKGRFTIERRKPPTEETLNKF